MSYLRFCILSCVVVLTACGGGGSNSENSPSTTQPVLVNAGSDQTIFEQETLSIDGAASGGEPPYNFVWTVPEGFTLEQADTTVAAASISAPVVVADTSYTVTLTATDSLGKTGTKSIVITVTPINELPQAQITANTLEDYAQFSYPVATRVTLDGSGSIDSDPQTNDADITAYEWQQVAGSDVLGNALTDLATLSFITPIHENARSVEFMLTVTDQEGAQNTAQVSLTLVGEQGTLPEVDAGLPLAVHSGEQMALFGNVSSLAPNASPINTTWTVSNGQQELIENRNIANTVATAPLVEQQSELVFELEAVDRFGNTAIDSVSYTVYPPVISPLNDTGVIFYTDENRFTNLHQADFPAQDASFGADKIAENNQLDKVGRGEHGFDFTALNENGDPVDNTSSSMECVRDNTTGLIWEVKSDQAGDLHNQDDTFAWYQDEDNGNFAGALNDASSSCSLPSGQCNTQAFVNQVNASGLCGFYDWRVPSHQELQSLVHYGRTSAPLIDAFYFPHLGNTTDATLWYWTSQSSADGNNEEIARNAWAIDFASGVDNFLNKTSERRVRLVRAGRSEQ